MRLTILGLGPGSWDQLTLEARAVIEVTPELWLRTRHLPLVDSLPAGQTGQSFDDWSGRFPEVDALDRAIADEVARLAERPAGVVYAVPGHPLAGDPSVRRLIAAARSRGGQLRIVAGLSLFDWAAARLAIDPVEAQLQIGDAAAPRSDPTRPLLVGHLAGLSLAARVKAALLIEYPADHPVTLLRAGSLDGDDLAEIPLIDLDRRPAYDSLTLAYLPPVPADRDFRNFAATKRIIARLRAPGGCPWDREQTAETLKPYVIEEAHEVVDAIDSGDPAKLAEELGDLLLQVVLQAQLADETGDFTIHDVCEAINTKLIRRHPHVFGDVQAATAREVLANWDILKDRERGANASILHGLPRHLPALAYAQALGRKLSRIGLRADWDADFVRARIAEIDAIGTAHQPDARTALTSLIAQILWRLATVASAHEIDLEDALRTLSRRIAGIVERAEADASGDRAKIARFAGAEWAGHVGIPPEPDA